MNLKSAKFAESADFLYERHQNIKFRTTKIIFCHSWRKTFRAKTGL